MHACLLIPEILKQIFSDIYFSGTEGWDIGYQHCRSASRPSLAALSRVCRSFTDVALDVLWAELENLEPLFTCLPRDLWTMTDRQRLIIQRPVTAADWSVFERYASRVRVLGTMHSCPFGDTDAGFVFALMGFSSQSLLVPNLRVLCCLGCPRDLHSCMRYLLGPNLVYLRLAPSEEYFWTNIMSSVLSGLARHSPRLKDVELHPTSAQVSVLALSGLAHLQKVSLTLLSEDPLSCLSRLVGLRELNIQIPEPFAHVQSEFRISSLDKFVIRSFSFGTWSGGMIDGWVVPCRQLQLISDTWETTPTVERALGNLTNRVLFDGLECITLDVANHIGKGFTLHTFTPLMRFSGLKEVDLSTLYTSLLDDDAFGSVVKSWPQP
ncbi:hypothetical protein DFH29DRAFT_590263 [Suillus ampliporus]|nr:hypothetical protein DFH29DRAFT_590263 [Suillus ampliporus]